MEESSVRFLAVRRRAGGGLEVGEEWRQRGEAHGELVQMNNLYRIPGIVCQGDDGRPVCKPKQTEEENAHTHTHALLLRKKGDRSMWELF